MLLIWFCLAWLIGIVLGDWFDLPLQPTAMITSMLSVLALIWWPRRDIRMPLLLSATLLLGAIRIAWAQPVTTNQSVWRYVDHELVLEGFVEQQPDRREDRQYAVLRTDALEINGQRQTVEGLVRLHLPPLPELRYGQRLRVEGMLEQPRTGDHFDYRAYLARQGIYATMTKPKLIVLPGESGSSWQRTALRLNDRARSVGLQLVSEPHASLLLGIALGVQSTIPPDVLDIFEATGTSHILVLSGWNISIIIVGVAGLFARVGIERKRAAAISLPIIGLYVLFVGLSPSIVRAAVMGSLAVFAVLVERESEAWTSLLLACVVMTMPNPNVLWDIGFQLSALATAGLFAFARPIEGWLSRHRPFCWSALHWTIEPLTATLAASLLSLPILLFHFGRLSLIAPLANILMLPAVPYAMLFGALALLCGIVSLPFGQLAMLLAWPFLQWVLLVVQVLADVPGAYLALPAFGPWWVWGYYGVVAGVWLWSRMRRNVKLSNVKNQGIPST
jgi:competence protein ComEC